MSLISNLARHRLMEIDSHILGLSMEFEKQNIIITEWETERAKTKSDHIHQVKYFFKNKIFFMFFLTTSGGRRRGVVGDNQRFTSSQQILSQMMMRKMITKTVITGRMMIMRAGLR